MKEQSTLENYKEPDRKGTACCKQPHNWYCFTCDLNNLFKCFPFAGALDSIGKAGWILLLILLDNAATCLRLLNVPIVTELTNS